MLFIPVTAIMMKQKVHLVILRILVSVLTDLGINVHGTYVNHERRL